jgi:hypothetical protein
VVVDGLWMLLRRIRPSFEQFHDKEVEFVDEPGNVASSCGSAVTSHLPDLMVSLILPGKQFLTAGEG